MAGLNPYYDYAAAQLRGPALRRTVFWSPVGGSSIQRGYGRMSNEPAPTWMTWREAMRLVGHPRHLRNTACIALLVGTILFGINQLDVVVRGEAGLLVWAKVAITYLVPFVVSNVGILVGTHQSAS